MNMLSRLSDLQMNNQQTAESRIPQMLPSDWYKSSPASRKQFKAGGTLTVHNKNNKKIRQFWVDVLERLLGVYRSGRGCWWTLWLSQDLTPDQLRDRLILLTRKTLLQSTYSNIGIQIKLVFYHRSAIKQQHKNSECVNKRQKQIVAVVFSLSCKIYAAQSLRRRRRRTAAAVICLTSKK